MLRSLRQPDRLAMSNAWVSSALICVLLILVLTSLASGFVSQTIGSRLGGFDLSDLCITSGR
jgi:hypothetical protein